MINELSRNPLSFLRYSLQHPPEYPHTPHSHSILSTHRNALICRCKFFCAQRRTVSRIRQEIALLIPNGNFDDLRFARFQRLSASISRFGAHQPHSAVTKSGLKNTVSACSTIRNTSHWLFLKHRLNGAKA